MYVTVYNLIYIFIYIYIYIYNIMEKSNTKIIIIDFEFTNYKRNNLVLISAAVTQTHIKSNIQRMRGRPLIISTDGRITLMNHYIFIKTIYLLKKIFKEKPNQLNVILDELHQSMENKTSNLTKSYLTNYLNYNNQTAVILLWNGNMDKNILSRLGFNNIMLNMTAYDTFNNNIFYLKLINFSNNKTISFQKLGYINKNGRLLSLLETHNIICKNNHNILLHDAVSDVRLTKCVFSYLSKIEKYHNILNKIMLSLN